MIRLRPDFLRKCTDIGSSLQMTLFLFRPADISMVPLTKVVVGSRRAISLLAMRAENADNVKEGCEEVL